MFTNECQVVCFKSLNNVINFTFILNDFLLSTLRTLAYGLPLRLHLSNQVYEPCIRSSKWVTSKSICNFSLNKISKVFIFFSETSNIICTSFFLPRKVKCCCLSLNTTYSAIMKSFFEGRSFFCFDFVQSKKGGKMPKRGESKSRKITVQDGVSSHGNRLSILEVSAKLERNEKTNEKTLSFKEAFYLQYLCWNFKSCS